MIRENIQKHLGLFLNSKLNFFDCINEKVEKVTNGVDVIRKMNLLLPRFSLLKKYKSYVRPHLDYDDVVYDQPNNSCLSDKIENVQYNAALAITGAIKGTSKEKLCQELGLESLKDRRWLRRMSYLYKIISTKLPPYLHELIPLLQRSHRYPGCFQTLRCRTTLFQHSFLPFTITEWNKLDKDIKNIDSRAVLRKKLLTFLWPLESDANGIYDSLGVRLPNRLRLGFSHLKEHNLSFRTTLTNDLNNINTAIAFLNTHDLLRVILYGDKIFNRETNCKILTASIKFIKDTQRFEKSLF